MGTRADFYIHGIDPARMRWIGSVAWDGYPSGLPDEVIKAADAADYTAAVLQMVAGRDDGTQIDQGWPWPWPDSRTTDYAYTWHEGRVMAISFGRPPWFPAAAEEEPEHIEGAAKVAFPDMSDVQHMAEGARSGFITLIFEGDPDQPSPADG